MGSYWTTDGTPNGSTLEYDSSYECVGFAKYVYDYLWGQNNPGNSVTQRNTNGTSSDFDGINIGARINCTVTEGGGNHSMVLADKTSTGVVVYHANWATKEENKYCIVKLTSWTYAQFASKFSEIKGNSYTQ